MELINWLKRSGVELLLPSTFQLQRSTGQVNMNGYGCHVN